MQKVFQFRIEKIFQTEMETRFLEMIFIEAEAIKPMDSQSGCGLSCTVQSLLCETSHLIGRHSAVQLKAWA